MKVSSRIRSRLAASLVLAVAVAAAASPGTLAQSGPGEEYIPFVTDFPRPAASAGTPEQFVPFVTDFPKATAPSSGPAAVQIGDVPLAGEASEAPAGVRDGGRDWGDVGLGAGVGLAFATLLGGAVLALRHRARPVHS